MAKKKQAKPKDVPEEKIEVKAPKPDGGPTGRVSMYWPESLKQEVRERVGGRGLTDFTLIAVKEKLQGYDAHEEALKEANRRLNEVKYLAQQLADAIAMGQGYDDPVETLLQIGLPDWVDTHGWPDSVARVVNAEDSTPEPVRPASVLPSSVPAMPRVDPKVVEQLAGIEPLPDPEPEVEGPPATPAIGDPGTIVSKPPKSSSSSSLLDRVRQKAAEKGVDISGIDLKPASETALPEPAAPSARSSEPAPTKSDTCPNCGAEMVAGECWECM